MLFCGLWRRITGPCTRLANAEYCKSLASSFFLNLTRQCRVCPLGGSMEGEYTLTEPKPLTLTSITIVTHCKPQLDKPQAEEDREILTIDSLKLKKKKGRYLPCSNLIKVKDATLTSLMKDK